MLLFCTVPSVAKTAALPVIFDSAWADIAATRKITPDETETARSQLAELVMAQTERTDWRTWRSSVTRYSKFSGAIDNQGRLSTAPPEVPAASVHPFARFWVIIASQS
jgi:hypothetical protein